MIKVQKKKSAKKRRASARDYARIKAEYMNSELVEVEAFFRLYMGCWDGSALRHTKGWRTEKDKMREDIYKARQKEIQENKQKVLSDALNNAINVAARRLEKAVSNDFSDIGEAKTAWTIIRTESGLPTNITHNTNVNTNEQRDIDAAARLREKLGLDKAAGKNKQDASVEPDNTVKRGSRKPTKKARVTK